MKDEGAGMCQVRVPLEFVGNECHCIMPAPGGSDRKRKRGGGESGGSLPRW